MCSSTCNVITCNIIYIYCVCYTGTVTLCIKSRPLIKGGCPSGEASHFGFGVLGRGGFCAPQAKKNSPRHKPSVANSTKIPLAIIPRAAGEEKFPCMHGYRKAVEREGGGRHLDDWGMYNSR